MRRNVPFCLNLRETAIHEQFRSADVATVVGRQKDDGLGNLFRLPSLPSGTVFESILIRSRPVSVDASSSFSPGVSVEPGDTALTRMWRCFKSVVHVRANERIAAFVAL